MSLQINIQIKIWFTTASACRLADPLFVSTLVYRLVFRYIRALVVRERTTRACTRNGTLEISETDLFLSLSLSLSIRERSEGFRKSRNWPTVYPIWASRFNETEKWQKKKKERERKKRRRRHTRWQKMTAFIFLGHPPRPNWRILHGEKRNLLTDNRRRMMVRSDRQWTVQLLCNTRSAQSNLGRLASSTTGEKGKKKEKKRNCRKSRFLESWLEVERSPVLYRDRSGF